VHKRGRCAGNGLLVRMLSRVQAQGKRMCAFTGPGRCLARGGRWRGRATRSAWIGQESADSNPSARSQGRPARSVVSTP